MFTYFAIVNGQQKNIQTLISPPGRESEKNKVLPFIPGLICMEFWAGPPSQIAIANTKPKNLPVLRFHIHHGGSVKCNLEQYNGLYTIIAHKR